MVTTERLCNCRTEETLDPAGRWVGGINAKVKHEAFIGSLLGGIVRQRMGDLGSDGGVEDRENVLFVVTAGKKTGVAFTEEWLVVHWVRAECYGTIDHTID